MHGQGILILEAGEDPEGISAFRYASSDRYIHLIKHELLCGMNDAVIARRTGGTEADVRSCNPHIHADFTCRIIGDRPGIVMVRPAPRVIVKFLYVGNFIFGFNIAMFCCSYINTYPGRIY